MSNEEEADEARDVVEAEGIMVNIGSNEDSMAQENMAHEHSGEYINFRLNEFEGYE